MNLSTVKKRLEQSLVKESATPCPKGTDRSAYLSQHAEELLSLLINPVRATVTEAIFEQHSYQEFCEGAVWAIARKGNNWLLMAEDKDEYALAYGDNATELAMLGFASKDALTEWLG